MVPCAPNEEGVVIYRTEDNTLQLDVQVSDETVWLTQQQMAELFQKDQSVIARHINNIFKEGELDESNMQILHNTMFKYRPTKVYNLDVIISVGYRVKSKRGTQFRRWATKIIRDYTLKGYAVSQRILAVEERIDRRLQEHTTQIQELQNKVDFFVRTNVPPVEQVFYNGEFFEARVLLEKLIKTAKNRVIIIDGYIDAATFEMLDVRAKGVTADIYSDGLHKTLRDSYNASSGLQPVESHKWSNPSHDRWLIIDDRVYHCGPSLKDMGQKLGAVSLLSIDANDILKKVR